MLASFASWQRSSHGKVKVIKPTGLHGLSTTPTEWLKTDVPFFGLTRANFSHFAIENVDTTSAEEKMSSAVKNACCRQFNTAVA